MSRRELWRKLLFLKHFPVLSKDQAMKPILYLATLLAMTACTTLNSETAKNTPSGQLCAFLDPNTWIITEAERQAIYAELQARKQDCVLPSGAAVGVVQL